MSDIPSDIMNADNNKYPDDIRTEAMELSYRFAAEGKAVLLAYAVAKAIYEERKRCARIADEMEPQESSLWSAGSEQNANLFGQAFASGSISKAILSGETK